MCQNRVLDELAGSSHKSFEASAMGLLSSFPFPWPSRGLRQTSRGRKSDGAILEWVPGSLLAPQLGLVLMSSDLALETDCVGCERGSMCTPEGSLEALSRKMHLSLVKKSKIIVLVVVVFFFP